MPIQTVPLTLPPSADLSKFTLFGREVIGVDPENLSPAEFAEIERLLYTHDALLFRNTNLSPEKQYAFTRAFDPTSESYAHGNQKTESTKKSILHYLKMIPRVPQVQLVGNGTLYSHEGLETAELKHPSHRTFHKTVVPPEDEAARGATRFCRWHMDAALYDLLPPKVTTLYALRVPEGPQQVCRYDDGTGDELPIPLGATAFASGRTITGLALESEGKEVPLDQLPPWTEDKIQVLPAVLHPCAAQELFVDPLPEGVSREGALYPDGAHLTDLKEIRDLLYRMQRPAIAPTLVYPHDWKEKDLVIFHNRGVMHTVVGSLKPDQVRVFHQSNLAASSAPVGPTPEDVRKYA
ncbi:hypothetical protein EDB84DRAFT_1546542 [Lactarius hengduanensis]|nr:hypothetical protein EDB84DRAFT_1546542 [Lactarius hengduanensis]